MSLKRILHEITPPFAVRAAQRIRASVKGRGVVEWEYMPDGWRAQEKDAQIKGWNVRAVLEAYRTKWPQFLRSVAGTGPLGVAPEAITPTRTDLVAHNILMSYGYALCLASAGRSSVSMLDWGGGIGHYLVISQALLPDVAIDYHCKDVACLAEHGQTLFPHAHFYADEACFARSYDFVLASTSLHYSEDWGNTLTKLAKAAEGFLFVTQLPVVERAASYVFVQRPYQYGYQTEYLGWCLNRAEFLGHAGALGLRLVREFIIGHQPVIRNAPGPCEYRGFLFQAADAPAPGGPHD